MPRSDRTSAKAPIPSGSHHATRFPMQRITYPPRASQRSTLFHFGHSARNIRSASPPQNVNHSTPPSISFLPVITQHHLSIQDQGSARCRQARNAFPTCMVFFCATHAAVGVIWDARCNRVQAPTHAQSHHCVTMPPPDVRQAVFRLLNTHFHTSKLTRSQVSPNTSA